MASLADEDVKMYCDSMATLAHAKDPKYHRKANTYRLVITTFVLLLHKER